MSEATARHSMLVGVGLVKMADNVLRCLLFTLLMVLFSGTHVKGFNPHLQSPFTKVKREI